MLGIDPGSRATGYGIVENSGSRTTHVAHGVIRAGDGELARRLLAVLDGVSGAIREFRPDEIAIEQVFVKLNVGSALTLGQARGAAICAVAQAGLPLHEYAPAEIKRNIVGNGRAEKHQIQHMVKVLLNLAEPPAADAADALACALCHAHLREHRRRLAALAARGLA
ncbi:MAG: crossover junction endodeoxyribonuclease RuvC [Gammaproteobacteria bacterium]|nr:crossover junction endodeoxyribonuclease RuvC [Gammaproteobacteria bacterium]